MLHLLPPGLKTPPLRAATAAAALLLGLALSPAAEAGVSVGVNIGLPVYGNAVRVLPYGAVAVGVGGHRNYWYHGGVWYRPWGPSYIVVEPPVGYYAPPPVVVTETRPAEPAAVSVPATRPDPVIYPRNGQSAQQTEYDRQECNRWAVSQPSAVADASVFQRAVEACMDGRGYTLR